MPGQNTKVIEIDADLHRRAKAKAAMWRLTLRAFVEAAIRELIEQGDSQKEAP